MDAGGHIGDGRRRRQLASLGAVLLLALSLGTGSTATAQPSAPPQASPQVPQGGRYLEPVFDDVTVTRDVPYREAVNSRGEPDTLLLDIYEPAGDTAERRPVIFFMSGGYFRFINKETGGVGETYARMGYVFVSIEYRVRPELDMSGFPDEYDEAAVLAAALDAYDDSVAALDWLRDRADTYRLDARALVALGASAGGFTAWNMAWLPGEEPRPGPTGIAAAVSVAGSPIDLAIPGPESPPVIAFHGTTDSVIPFSWAAEPCNAAADLGARCDLVAYEGAGHPLVDPNDLLQHGDDMIRRTVAFVAETVLVPLGYSFDGSPGGPGPGPPGPVPGAGPPGVPGGSPPGHARPAVPVRGTPSYTG